jgi:glycosyltransferase involved in cell wall biosynthesis
MDNLTLEVPINGLSFGNCSINILKQLFKLGINPKISLIGGSADVSSFDNLNKDFLDWMTHCLSSFNSKHSRDNICFKLWHINGSMSSASKEQVLFSFYELDSPTSSEINIVKNQKNVLFSSKYSRSIFENFGCKNVEYCPLGFDSDSFYRKDRKENDGKIIFGLVGKLERRKQHHKVLLSWAKKYGNNPKYLLNCSIKNPFISNEQQSGAIRNLFNGAEYFNINFVDYMPTNSLYNDYLNSNDIVIGMSAGEGWGLPEFQSVCLGKHAVILNAHAYKDWANNENSVMVNPSGKIPCYDGTFFHQGAEFNQGSYFDWNEDEFISACEEAEKRFIKNKINKSGEELAKVFTWEKTTSTILSILNK